jgi:hypothetical protein
MANCGTIAASWGAAFRAGLAVSRQAAIIDANTSSNNIPAVRISAKRFQTIASS